MSRFFFALAVTTALQTATAHAEQKPAAEADPIIRAAQDEMARYQAIKVGTLTPPYYLSTTIDDEDSFSTTASFGALRHRGGDSRRVIHVDVRVGSMDFDNKNFSDRDHPSFAESMMVDMAGGPVPLDPDYDALRQALWLRFDAAYKSAVESIARKKAFLETNAATDRQPDFTPAPVISQLLPIAKLQVDEERWVKLVKSASAVFRDASQVMEGSASFYAGSTNQYFISSDPAQSRFGDTQAQFVLEVSTQAPDGMALVARQDFRGRVEGDLPKDAEIIKAAKALADRLKALAAAPTLPEDYSGPVLFSGRAANRFFLSTVAEPLSNPRESLGEPREGRLINRLGKHIATKLLTVRDDPTQKAWKGQSLSGWYPIDDESVKPQPITLIDKGILKTCFMSRVPIAEVKQTNGHMRGRGGAMSNLFVDAAQPVSRAALKKKLIELAKASDLPYGILVEDSGAGHQSGMSFFMGMMGDRGDIELSAPNMAYRVYLNGKEELVRGASFKPASYRVLDDIVAMGNDASLLNTISQSQPVSVVAPSVLVKQLELKKPSKEFEKLPAVSRPVITATP